MPWLLIRAMVRDQLRLLLLTTGILVTVIAFGATIKPLAGESIVTGVQVAKYMALAMVPMLQFAMPFAGGFATTLSMHRMTVDHEVQALAASGVSYVRILLPSIVLGLVVSAGMVGLTQWAIPRFWGLLEQMLTRDVAQVFAACVDQGLPFQTDDLQISAAGIQIIDHPTDTQADTRLLLTRVAVADLNAGVRVETDVTADRAAIDIYRRPGSTAIKFVLADTVAYNALTGQLMRSPQIAPEEAIIVPSVRSDHTKAMTREELLHLRANPDEYSSVIRARQELAGQLRTAEFRRAVEQRLKADGRLTLSAAGDPGRDYVIHADDMPGNEFQSSRGVVQVQVVQNGEPVTLVEPRLARLEAGATQALGGSLLDLVMVDCAVRDLRNGASAAVNHRATLAVPGVTVADFVPRSLNGLKTNDLLPIAAQALPTGHPRLDQEIEERISRLHHEYDEVGRETTARLVSRVAVVFTAPLLIVLGSILAMYLRTSLPLTIYMWSFLPSVMALILLSAGEQMLRDGLFTGWFVLWSGNGILAVAIVWTYSKLARN